MNILSILDQLSSPNSTTAAPRRHVLHQLGAAGARLVAAGLPIVLATSPAQARPSATALDAVLLLLKLEELQVAFYTQAASAAALAAYQADITTIQAHQRGHLTFLRQFLTNAGVAVPATPTFDFSGQRGNTANPVLFADVFTSPANFLQLAQQLEDAAAGIYLSQAAVFTERPTIMALYRMQSVEARHAARIRSLRQTLLGTAGRAKSWPSRADTAPSALIRVPAVPATTPASTTSIYSFENNETQLVGGSRIVPYATLLADASKLVQSNSLAEAFDELLPAAQATALLNIFG
ncbi:ferritin-like domain-containing protein [Hymenobacter sp. ASUV-10]|uniref:Ferritin-like domain-containing protein n=1 Tax=Hymenobacter aranciens TaxID=3063996 RepID=A0ABT9B8N8_9BACT|nr:ferritin-like domain-containing protein [Hymenobacter sp. ASUV-10]MDO7874641.1 ferritin-like domain-containing protein [Hymenobacter sp. ASUV-10]